MHANTQKIRQVDVQGGFTAAAGHNFYTARAFPREYWNRVAFVNEPTGHVVHRAVIERRGSGFTETDGWNVAASDDEWFAPVHAEVGPDGALWLLDFYDFIIQHNPTPAGPIAQGYQYLNGRGNAYESPLREQRRGRVYRIVWKGATPYTPLSLSVSEPMGLTAALRHDNMFWRLTAQRLLVERGQTDVVPQLITIVDDRAVDAIGLNSPAVHALWTLHGLGALDGALAPALSGNTRSPTPPPACKAAQSVLPRTARSVADRWRRGPSPRGSNVRLNALVRDAGVSRGRARYAVSQAPDVIKDEWLPEAVDRGDWHRRVPAPDEWHQRVRPTSVMARGERRGPDWSGVVRRNGLLTIRRRTDRDGTGDPWARLRLRDDGSACPPRASPR
jgi:hypothetical protein